MESHITRLFPGPQLCPLPLPTPVLTLSFHRPQGKSYLYFTQFKAELRGAEIEYAMAYVSVGHGNLRTKGPTGPQIPFTAGDRTLGHSATLLIPRVLTQVEGISGRPTMWVVPAEWLEEPGWPPSAPFPRAVNDRLFPQSTRALSSLTKCVFGNQGDRPTAWALLGLLPGNTTSILASMPGFRPQCPGDKTEGAGGDFFLHDVCLLKCSVLF